MGMSDSSQPLIDLHRHLEGSVRLETILDLSRHHNLYLPADTIDDVRELVQVSSPQPGVMAMLMPRVRWMTGVMVNGDACRRIAFESVVDAFHEGLVYLELRFCPAFMAETHKLPLELVTEAVIDGVEQASKEVRLHTSLIGIIDRTYGPIHGRQQLELLLTYKDKIVAVDLAGDESNFPAILFKDHFQKAKSHGFGITIHAGEEGGPDSIWYAIKELGATRIGHATSAISDPKLMDHLLQNKIGLEINLTSNVQSSTVTSYRQHPLKLFLKAGLLATINTDDPVISGIDLPYEYNIAAGEAGINEEDIQQLRTNALEIAFLTPKERIAISKIYGERKSNST